MTRYAAWVLIAAAAGCGIEETTVATASDEVRTVERGTSCAALGLGDHEVEVPATSGTHALDARNTVDLAIGESGDLTFRASLRVDGVLVHTGDRSAVWAFDAEVDGWPVAGPEGADVDAVSICFDHDLRVGVDAFAHMRRRAYWTATVEDGPRQTVHLRVGERMPVIYRLRVVPGYTDQFGHRLEGPVHIENPTPVDAVIDDVNVVVDGIPSYGVRCPVAFPHVLPAGGALECSYESHLFDMPGSYPVEVEVVTGGGLPSATASTLGRFDSPTTEIDYYGEYFEASTRNDGIVVRSELGQGARSVSFIGTIGPYAQCGWRTADADVFYYWGDRTPVLPGGLVGDGLAHFYTSVNVICP